MARGQTSSSIDSEFVERAAQRFARTLAGVVADYRRRGRSPSELLGEPEAFGERAVAAQAPAPSPWDDLVGPFLRCEGVEARLGITRQAVAARAARRRLLRMVTADGVHLYPTWQFADGGLVPGLDEVISLFAEEAVDGWTLAGWLRTPDPELCETPLETVKRGDVAGALAAARSASAALGS
ncbi:MAG TPA: hypothetical protein VNB06_13265 [Thermoanaerobaculia bacterium]|nr:hypothetical protein [Thermoanaerobaculia bacterium]